MVNYLRLCPKSHHSIQFAKKTVYRESEFDKMRSALERCVGKTSLKLFRNEKKTPWRGSRVAKGSRL
ncbi:hypothetical protein, partial [Vibrio cholerae]|uniref:hypothetical protein n=1 Tax=Vibrio cholerae TaxID=666 RepID=UPI0019625311